MLVRWEENWGDGNTPLWPYLAGLELAPTTAKFGDEKKVRTVASVVILRLGWKSVV